ncbi:DsbA family protein [Streptomyces smaragdinus]|nr:thioredoxin domain-containing protein [Streptomyces smaragdinus]
MRGAHRAVASVCGVLLAAAAAGCGGGIKDTSVPPPKPYRAITDVPEALGKDGTTIVVGDPGAPTTVHLLEDPRCPVCEEFELQGAGEALRVLVEHREVRAEYTMASFLDDRLGGKGSRKAVNALRAALDRDKFTEYHAVLYENQPEEAVDGFTDAYLLDLASKVDGLRSPAFDRAVRGMTYEDFVTASERAYEAVGDDPRGPGTPTAVIDGTPVPAEYNGILFDPELFREAVRQSGFGVLPWETATP